MGLLACVAVIIMVAGFEKKFGRGMEFIAKYTMPIFTSDAYIICSTAAICFDESWY